MNYPIIINNQRISKYVKNEYKLHDLNTISTFLQSQKTFKMIPLKGYLFSAAAVGQENQSGYQNVWVRDNVMIAYSYYITGNKGIACKIMGSLMCFFTGQKNKFTAIIEGKMSASNPMNRPHIRFNGISMKNLEEKWPHAQNDALGYFFWLYCHFIMENIIPAAPANIEALALFPLYFKAIKYWKDEDSGHWEETRKINASFEVCLKTDVGIYEMEMYNTKTNFSYFTYEKKMKEKSEKEINKKTFLQ